MLFNKHEDFSYVWNQNVTQSYKETTVVKRKLDKLIESQIKSVSIVIVQTYAKIGPLLLLTSTTRKPRPVTSPITIMKVIVC